MATAPANGVRITSFDADLGARLRAHRKRLGLSQEKLAAAVGVTFQQIQKYERGDNRVSAGRLVQLAGALHTTPHALLGWAQDTDTDTDAFVRAAALPGVVDVVRALCQRGTETRRAVAALLATLPVERVEFHGTPPLPDWLTPGAAPAGDLTTDELAEAATP